MPTSGRRTLGQTCPVADPVPPVAIAHLRPGDVDRGYWLAKRNQVVAYADTTIPVSISSRFVPNNNGPELPYSWRKVAAAGGGGVLRRRSGGCACWGSGTGGCRSGGTTTVTSVV